MRSEALSNLETIGDLIGSIEGISAGLNHEDYIEGIIRQAHNHTANVFDATLAATANAGYLSHVFEFGTTGITPGPSRFPDPTAPEARLYIHDLEGTGGNQSIKYSFRPATQPNPRPTTAATGVPSKYLSRLSRRKQIFWNRAFVMETGMVVDPAQPKKGKFVFVPFYGKPPNDSNNRRGYMMYDASRNRPIDSIPGDETRGTFEAFWMMWWSGAGSEIMEAEMRASVVQDIETAEAEMTKKLQSVKLKPVQATNIVGAVAKSRSWMSKLFGVRHRMRKPNGR